MLTPETKRYVERLATQTATDISRWDLTAIFAPGGQSIVDRPEINKVFFEQKERSVKEALERLARFELPPQAVEKIKTLKQKIALALNRTLGAEVENVLKKATEHLKQYEALMRAATEKNAQLIRTQDKDIEDVISEIHKIAGGSFWSLWRVSGSGIDFVTESEVVCSQKNPAINQDVQVSFGRFRARLDLESSVLHVWPHHNNKRVAAGNVHCHVYTSGDVCWGTAGEEVARSLVNGRYSRVFEILANILVNPSYDIRPYDIQSFNPGEPGFGAEDQLGDYVLFEPGDVVEIISTTCSEIQNGGFRIGEKVTITNIHTIDPNNVDSPYQVMTKSPRKTDWWMRGVCLKLSERPSGAPIRKLKDLEIGQFGLKKKIAAVDEWVTVVPAKNEVKAAPLPDHAADAQATML